MIITPLLLGSRLVSILFHGSQTTLVGAQSGSLLESQAYGLIAGEPNYGGGGLKEPVLNLNIKI